MVYFTVAHQPSLQDKSYVQQLAKKQALAADKPVRQATLVSTNKIASTALIAKTSIASSMGAACTC